MKTRLLKRSLVAEFALTGFLAVGGALSPVAQALAGETSLTLNNGDTATGQGSTTVRPPVNDATAPGGGSRLADGTIFYAGDSFFATPADAPGVYTWEDGKNYCDRLNANGHDDWTLPTRDQLNHL